MSSCHNAPGCSLPGRGGRSAAWLRPRRLGRRRPTGAGRPWPVLLLLLALGPSPIRAELRSDWGGFLSQGWARSDHNAFYGGSDRDAGSFDYRELGLNGFVAFTPRARVNGQLLSRRAGEGSDGSPQLDYLFADLTLLLQMERQFGVRVGRIKNPLGFYNETRDVAFTRPGIIMPQPIYFDQVRELQLSSDGAALYYRSTGPFGNWLFDAQHGALQTGNSTEARFLGHQRDGQFHASQVSLGRLIFEPPGDRWRVGLTQVDAHMPFAPAGSDPLLPGTVDLRLSILSAQYNLEHWSFTAEAMQAQTRWRDLGPLVPTQRTLEAWYLQADYRLTARWQLLARLDRLVIDRNDQSGNAFSQQVGIPAHQQFARDRTLGLLFQPSPRWDLRAELHQVDGTGWLPPEDNPDPGALKRRWKLLLLQAALRF